jgi:hypothetical protein
MQYRFKRWPGPNPLNASAGHRFGFIGGLLFRQKQSARKRISSHKPRMQAERWKKIEMRYQVEICTGSGQGTTVIVQVAG